jgi:hypothetical protein
MGYELSLINDRYLVANLALDTGWIAFKFPSAPRVPKRLRLQRQGTEQYLPVWSVLRAIAQPNVLGTAIDQ